MQNFTPDNIDSFNQKRGNFFINFFQKALGQHKLL